MIIAISGVLKSGKDLSGQIIQDYYKSKGKYFEIKKFGDKLKNTVCSWINCTREQLEDRVFKDTPIGKEWDKWELTYSDKYQDTPYWKTFLSKEEAELYISEQNCVYSYDIEEVIMTPRILMQLLGTEAGRNQIHPDLWINTTFAGYNKSSNWIITDTRFINEISKIKEKGGIVIRIERDFSLRHPGYNNLEEVKDKDPELYKQLTHYSEISLDKYNEFDYIIQNNGTIDELIEKTKQIIESYETYI